MSLNTVLTRKSIREPLSSYFSGCYKERLEILKFNGYLILTYFLISISMQINNVAILV